MPVKLNDKAIKYIEGKNLAFLATTQPDGSPHVAPVWVDHEGDLILVNTVMGRVKQKNTAKDKRVSLSITDSNNKYDFIVIHGRVVAQTQQGADAHIDKMGKKYLGVDKYTLRPPNEKRVILEIEPTRIISSTGHKSNLLRKYETAS